MALAEPEALPLAIKPGSKFPTKRGGYSAHFWSPLWRILAPGTVLGFHTHQLCDLAKRTHQQIREERGQSGVLLQCPPLISELAHFGQQDTYLAGEGFTEIVDVSGKDAMGILMLSCKRGDFVRTLGRRCGLLSTSA